MAAVTAIGIDIGGTRIKGGLVEGDEVVAEELIDVGARTQDAVVDALVTLVTRLGGGTSPIGIAAAGVVDQRRRSVRESPNFPEWKDFALGAALAAKTGREVAVDNDANAVILGEARFGVARGSANVFGYTLGTGVGGGIVIDGRPYRGERGMAAELGHVTVEPEGRPCGCGNRGCLEQYVGKVGLLQTLADAGPLAALLSDPDDAPRHLAALADAADPAALAIFERMGRYLGQAAAAALHTLDIATIVIAGGIAGAFDHLAPAMRSELERRTFRSMHEGTRILQGSLGTRAGVLGAAALVLI